ncbi:MAG TPA: sugar kinase [Epulopiscium sp.]|nr:sugar kinase [Candidatus Epulonipiscium sp.]
MSEVMLIGEPIVILTANELGNIQEVTNFTRSIAGAEINVAIGLTNLNHPVSYVTKLGGDPFGQYIENFLNDKGIDTSYVSYNNKVSTAFQLKGKTEDGDPEVVYFRKGSAASHLSKEDVAPVSLEGIKLIHITGIPPALSKGSREAIYEMIKKAKDAGIFITFDPNIRPTIWDTKEEMISVMNDIASKCDMILPGISEGKILTGSDDPEKIADFYLSMGAKIVVIKLGAEGAFVKTGNESYKVPGFKVDKVVDTVGAGDGFAVGVLSGVLEGLTLRDAVTRGNAIGSLQVMVQGDNEGLPTHETLEKYLNSYKLD